MSRGLFVLQGQKRLLDVLWLTTLLVVYLALALPWFLRALEIELAPIAWLLFAYAAVYLVAGRLLERLRRPRWLRSGLTLLQLAGIVVLGVVWHLAGGLQNPLFLLVFMLPVMASALALERWQTYLLAFSAIMTVLAVAWLESPDLRAYLLQLGLPVRGLMAFFVDSHPPPEPFVDLRPPPAFLFVSLELFAAFLMVTTILAVALSERMLAGADAEKTTGLAEQALRASSAPAALIDAESGAVVLASDSLRRSWLLDADDFADKRFQELVGFADPAAIATLLTEGGEIPLTTYRVGPESRVARIRAHCLRHQDRRYTQVVIEDLSELDYLRAALDGIAEPWLVIGPDQRLLYFNHHAQQALGDLYLGLEAAAVLAADNRPGTEERSPAWWTRAFTPTPVSLGGHSYRGHAIASSQGEEGLILLRLRPVETAT